MRLGILSDSHGRHEMTRRAVARLRERGAEVFVHLGDIETERVLEELAGLDAHVVFGNTDWNLESLASTARHLDLRVDHPAGRLRDNGRVVAFTHGDRPSLIDQALAEGVDYLLHGHTHKVRDERVGATRVINPGALFRARRYTAAYLDTEADRLEIIEIPRPE